MNLSQRCKQHSVPKINVPVEGALSLADEKAEVVTRSVTNYRRCNAPARSDHVRTNYEGVEVIVRAGIMAAPASWVINSDGGRGSVGFKDMRKLQKQEDLFFQHQKHTLLGFSSHLNSYY